MIKQFLLLLVAITLRVYGTSHVDPCSGISKGIYCLHGLIGYKDCTREDGRAVFQPCPIFQICQCGLNRKCEETQQLCGYKNPPPEMPRTFMVQFHGKGVLHTATGDKAVRTTGVIYQDANARRLKIQTKLHYGTDVKVVEELHVQDPSSTLWIKYKTVKHGEKLECHKTYEREFPEFFDDLQRFSYNIAERQWEFKDGPLHQNDKFTIKKFVVAKTFTGEYFPQSCQITKHGSSNTKEELVVTEDFYLVRFNTPHEAWFRVPDVCLKDPKDKLDELDFHDGIIEESKDAL